MPIERNLARAAVHDANLAGADKMAVEEFHEAGLALKKGKRYSKRGTRKQP